VYLRPPLEADVDMIAFGKNDPYVRETLFLFSPMTRDQVRNEMNQWIDNKEIALFTICRKEDELAVGQAAFVRIDQVSRAAVYYIAIYDSQYWSKGYGKESTELMLSYAFDILNLNRIQLHVSVENERGVLVYKKSGFQLEGTLRQAMYHHNRYVDFYVMGILRKDYYEMKE